MASASYIMTETNEISEIPEDEELDLEIAAEIMNNWDESKAMLEEYKESKLPSCHTESNPKLIEAEKLLYPTIRNFLIKLLRQVTEKQCFHKPKTSFNGIDQISEFLYNSNPKYPERKEPWVEIFDLNWVIDYLQQSPRPYYPLSLLMSKNTAARYIQAHLRGFWVRRRSNLQEMRNFWKTIKFKRDSNGRVSMTQLEIKKKERSKSKSDVLPRQSDTI